MVLMVMEKQCKAQSGGSVLLSNVEYYWGEEASAAMCRGLPSSECSDWKMHIPVGLIMGILLKHLMTRKGSQHRCGHDCREFDFSSSMR